jgi:DNA-binding MarR family transcriptional regulator/predicted N-acetyltransferase YhbS
MRGSTSNAGLVRAFSRELARAGGLLSPDYLESGLSLGEARCLYELGQAAGLAVSALADALGLDLGYVSRVVSRLAAQRLVTKRAEGGDGRSRRVMLTAAGRARLARMERQADLRIDGWLRSKPGDGVDGLLDGLRAFLGPADRRPEIRDARRGDVGRIIARHAEIYDAEFHYPPSFEGYVVEAFADFVKDFSPPRDRIFVAERGGRFLGSVASKGLARATAQLRFLLLEPAARGLGLGRRLVGAVVDHARASGERRIILETASDLDAARGLYAAFGFRRTRSLAGAPWLPAGVRSERWELELDS